MSQGKDEDRIVYSTERGRICPECGQAPKECVCRKGQAGLPGSGRVRISRSTQGRKGKAVTVITGLPLSGAQLTILAKELKVICGAGGTVKDGAIEIQGEHLDRLKAELVKRGYSF